MWRCERTVYEWLRAVRYSVRYFAEFSGPKGFFSKKKDNMNVASSSKMNADDLEDHGKQEFEEKEEKKEEKKIGKKKEKKIGNKKDDDVEVEDPEYGKVDCTTGIVNWSFTLGPWEAMLLKTIIILFLAGCLVFLVMKLIKEGRLLTEKDLVEKKA